MTQRLPVVDGDSGADIYGHATTERGALRVARREWTADPISHVECYGPIQLAASSGGGTLPRAWVFITEELDGY